MFSGFDLNGSSNFSYIPQSCEGARIPFDDYLRKTECSATKEKISSFIKSVGYILTDDDQFNGTALLISSEHILVLRHCFPQRTGRICFSAIGTVFAKTLIDGERAPLEGYKADYKILKILGAYTEPLQPAQLSVSSPIGQSLQINYQVDENLYVTPYESTNVNGGHAARSDESSVISSNGDSGGVRVCCNNFAVHSIHQGESEAIRINDIYHSIQSIRSPISETVLRQLIVIDLAILYLHASPLSLCAHHVVPDRHGTLTSTITVGEAVSLPVRDVIDDILALLQGNPDKQSFYAAMWGRNRTIYREETFGTYQQHGTRLDHQGYTTAGWCNLQIQVGKKTIATVLVSNELSAYGDNSVKQVKVVDYVFRKFEHAIWMFARSRKAIIIEISPCVASTIFSGQRQLSICAGSLLLLGDIAF